MMRMFVVLRTFSAYNAITPFKENLGGNLSVKTAFFFLNILSPIKKGKGLRDGERLAQALKELGPAFIKLGQTLATRPDIVGDDMAEDLLHLQDRLPAFGTGEVLKVIEENFNAPIDKSFKSFDLKAAAAASIAQVHFAVTNDGKDVAVKILRPGIRRLFSKDLETLFWVSGLLEKYSAEAKRLRLGEIVATIERSVIAETNLLEEATSAETLSENMAGFAGYRVPEIHWDLTTERVLTMERIYGIPIHKIDELKTAGHNTTKLAETVVHAFLRQSIEDGFFHADLHQGNLLVESNGTLVAIDFGIMGHLDLASRNFLGEILWGFQQRDFDDIARVHFDAGYVPNDQSLEKFSAALREIAEPIIDKNISEISFGHLLASLMATTRTFSMQTQPQLLMLQRSMVMVEGLALSLDENANMWKLSRPELIRFVINEKGFSKPLQNILTSFPQLFEFWLSIFDTAQHNKGDNKDLRVLIADLIAICILLLFSTIAPKRT
ncbi:MAG: ubiquinone biosynthesis protein UbiB [Sphingomonadales bacterium]|nr:ubiquinone biosynthesis protein UbiB [Sphingomonadales bacterium]